jgi:hypothetical protein
MTSAMRFGSVVCLGVSFCGPFVRPAAAQHVPVPLVERGRGAQRVVVGRVAAVNPQWQVNEFGDRLIVSNVHLSVEETLKGDSEPLLSIEVEGGTIGELTLHVSDLATFAPGDRAVFYLKRNGRGVFVPHLRGQGVLKLDLSNRVPGSSLTLAEIRRTMAAR